MNKKTLYSKEARDKVLAGINKIADAVCVTLGPSGCNVLIGRSIVADYATHSLPLEVTKDGYRVTQGFDVDDFVEKTGVLLAKECAQRSVDQSGDGTTTTVVLFRKLVMEGIKAIERGANPMELKREIDAAVARVVEALRAVAIQIGADNEKIFQVAAISANNDPEIGALIADAFRKIGNDGMIDIEAGRSVNTEIKIAKGYRFDKGWVHDYFVTNRGKQIAEFENPLIVLYNKVITHHTQVDAALDHSVRSGRPIVFICPDATDQGLAYLAVNNRKGSIKCCVVRAPGIGDEQRQEMEDMAILTGATYVADNRGVDIRSIEMGHFGSARKIVVTNQETVIIEGLTDQRELNKLLNELQMNKAQAKNEEEAWPIEKRIAKLKGGVAVIQVGAATDTEMKEKMDRFDDAVRAVKSAIAEGYTAGGGTALLRIPSGNRIVDEAMAAVLRQICDNAGLKASRPWQFWKKADIFRRVCNEVGSVGYNAKTGKVEDLIAAGVIDPVKVLRCALQNAASSASMVLTTECVIVDTF